VLTAQTPHSAWSLLRLSVAATGQLTNKQAGMAAQVVAHQAQPLRALLLVALQHQDRVMLAALPINFKVAVVAVLVLLALLAQLETGETDLHLL
jgi:hypothetical protein